MLGNGRLEAMCFDGNKRLANVRVLNNNNNNNNPPRDEPPDG